MASIVNVFSSKKNAKKEDLKNNETEIIEDDVNDLDLLKTLDSIDLGLVKEMGNLYSNLSKDRVNLNNVEENVKNLSKFCKSQKYEYLNNLMYPENCKGVKIPTPIPIPSCSFQLHNCITLRTNALGNLAVVFNPFFLASESLSNTNKLVKDDGSISDVKFTNLSSFFVNNYDDLNGHAPSYNWFSMNIGQMIPNVYDQYRLVSASIVVKYIGRLDIVSGVIGGAVVFDENPCIGGTLTRITQAAEATETIRPFNLSKYANFDLAMDSFYHQENLVLEGIRGLYFPLDNSYEEYVKTLSTTEYMKIRGSTGESDPFLRCVVPEEYYKSGFNYMIYVLGAPGNSNCFKCDIYCNFECLPNAQFLNYLPLTMSPMGISSSEKGEANSVIQKKPIMKIEEKGEDNDMPNIWYKLKKKFKNGFPSIKKLVNKGLMKNLTFFKGGLGLAGSMLETKMDLDNN